MGVKFLGGALGGLDAECVWREGSKHTVIANSISRRWPGLESGPRGVLDFGFLESSFIDVESMFLAPFLKKG